MIKKTYLAIIAIILAAAIMPLFTPAAVAQEATATLHITDCDTGCILTLSITSPASVSEFQVSIKATSSVTLSTSQTTLTGFMAGSALLILEGATTDEYRWFNLQSPGGTQGTLTVPISDLEAGETIFLDAADFLDANGNRIDSVTIGVAGTLTTTVRTTSTSTSTIRLTSTATATATTTSTSILRSTSTATTTATTTTTTTVGLATVTQTVSSTSTASTTIATTVTSGQTTSTITNTQTQTGTSTVEEGSPNGIYAIILAIIAIILLGLAVLRQQRKDMFPF